jgi:ankyrin repeat protein
LIAIAKEKIKKCKADLALLREDGHDMPEQEIYDESPGSMDLPVIRAIYSGDPKAVHKLLAQGLDVNSVILDKARRNRTALYFATKRGSVTFVQLLLDYGAACADFELHEAVIGDRVDIAKLYIAHGANIHTPNPFWNYYAVFKHVKSIEMAKVFIEAGQTQDKINGGLMGFYDHSHEESLEIVEFFLQHGAQFNGPDYFPLAKILRRQHVNVARLLLEKGADVHGWDKYGGCLCEAVKSSNGDAVRLLLNYKANVNVLKDDGTSALIVAAGCSFDGIVSLLLDHGADIENCTKNGVRALHALTRAGDLETVPILLQRGAAPNVQMSDGRTPLHIAVKTGQIAMTALLLENGADPKLVDSEGMAAQQPASKSHQSGTEAVLQKVTGDITAQESSQSLTTAGDDGRSKASSSKGTSTESHDQQIPKTRKSEFLKRIFRHHKERKDSGSGDRSH